MLYLLPRRYADLQAETAKTREARLRIGAAGQLFLEGKLKVLPAEPNDFRKFNPMREGAVVIDEKEIEAREDAIVEQLPKSGKVYLILGGGHDLKNNLEGKATYTVLTPKGYPKGP